MTTLMNAADFRSALKTRDTPFLIEMARQQANAMVKQGHSTLPAFIRELADRLEALEAAV